MEEIIFESQGPFKKAILNRPKSLNALNSTLFQKLLAFLEKEDSSFDGVILSGAGEKAFSAGADLKEFKTMTSEQLQVYLDLANRTIDALEHYPKPTIGVLHGYTLGGGLELALACDFLIAEEGALFGMPETKIGLIPGFHGIERLKKRIGIQRTKELVFTGKTITAYEALAFKLVDVVVKKEFLESYTLDTLKSFTEHPKAVSLAKLSSFETNTDPLFHQAFNAWKTS